MFCQNIDSSLDIMCMLETLARRWKHSRCVCSFCAIIPFEKTDFIWDITLGNASVADDYGTEQSRLHFSFVTVNISFERC